MRFEHVLDRVLGFADGGRDRARRPLRSQISSGASRSSDESNREARVFRMT